MKRCCITQTHKTRIMRMPGTNKSYNKLYDHRLHDLVTSAYHHFLGTHYTDPETGEEYDFPGKQPDKFPEAYDYLLGALEMYCHFADTFKEILLICSQIKHAQDFALANDEFSTDEILTFSYKNWVIRINTIAEKLFLLANHIYRLRLSHQNLVNEAFMHDRIKCDNNLYLTLLKVADFLYDQVLVNAKTKALKRSRNEILHNGQFSHKLISSLNRELFFQSFSERVDPEDLYIMEGVTSEKIKHEISDVSDQFLSRIIPLLDLFADEFDQVFSLLIGEPKATATP